MNISKWFAMLAVMLALTGFVMAETNDTDTDLNKTQGQALNVRYDHLQCKVAFTNTQIDILNKYTDINQTANKNKLLADMTTLKVFLNNLDKDGFDNYTSETIRPDLQKATHDLTEVKKNFRQYNLTNESKTEVIAELKDAIETYSECTSDKEVKMAQVMEKHMDNWNKQLGKISDKMNKKNITTENLTAIMDEIDARNAELRALIASGNITTMREFMKEYHDSQFKYAAKFEVARLKGYKDKLEPIADRYNMSGRLHDIDERIADAEEHARKGYKNDSFKDSWEDIKDAGKDMKEAAKEINKERMREQQKRMGDRQQGDQDRQRDRINDSNESGEDD